MKTSHFLQLLALSALWGATFPMMRVAAPLLGPGVLALGRIAVATVTLALIMRAIGQRWPWQHWREMVLLSLVVVAAPFFLFSSASLALPAGYVALLNSTGVVFGTLISAWLKEDTLSARKLLGCLCGFLGVGLIVPLTPFVVERFSTTGTAVAMLTLCYSAAQFVATNGRDWPPSRWTARASDVLPVPVSPSTSNVARDDAARIN